MEDDGSKTAISMRAKKVYILVYETSDTDGIHRLQLCSEDVRASQFVFIFRVAEVALAFVTGNPSAGCT